jgi:hypothetical protein
LIKIVPIWGLALISTSILFLVPLIYKSNQELIDHHVANVSELVNQQTAQVKQLASEHAARATDATKQYASDYSAKAQELIGRSTSPSASAKPIKTEPVSSPAYKNEDFPAAPKEDFTAAINTSAEEPLIST